MTTTDTTTRSATLAAATAPDPDRIEDALTRVQTVADILDTLAEKLDSTDKRYGRMLSLCAADLLEARETVYPAVNYIIASRRAAA